MTEPIKHRGSGQTITPELLVRQVLLEGLVELAGDRFRQDELFARVDDMLQGTQDAWAKEMRAALLRMAQPGRKGGISVAVGYPQDEALLPYVSIIGDAGSEEGNQASMGDVLGRHFDQDTGTLYTVIGTEWSSTIQIGSWATVGEESTLLHQLVKHVAFRAKGSLIAAGVRDVSLSESGFAPGEVYYPRVMWVPMLRLTLEWTYRQTRRKRPVATSFQITTTNFGNEDL